MTNESQNADSLPRPHDNETLPYVPGGDASGEPPALSPGATSSAAPALPSVPGYEVLGELGRGGMGVVYRARQVKLNRLVALKMILAGGHAGEAEMTRFRAEAEAVARLQHPNVVQVYEVGEHGGLPYFSLEFCPGGSLAARLGGAPLQVRDAAALVQTLARAMDTAHRAGIVHRDLKPANVLLAADATPKIADFGLARRLDASQGHTQSGAILGTPSYMAPEQAGGQGKEAGPAADVYALGAVLYECLTGRPPFRAATPLETVFQVLSDEPPPPRRLRPAVPADLEAIALKCLEKRPAARYASARDLAADLGRFLDGEAVRARRPNALERARRRLRKHRQAALSAAGVVLAVLATLGAVWWNGGFRPRPAAQPAKEIPVADRVKIQASNANLRSLGLAFHTFQQNGGRNGAWPAAAIPTADGRPLLSWRVALLPALNQHALYERFKLDEPWDSPHNRELLRFMPKVFEVPGVSTPRPYMTFYRVFVGPGALFEPDPKRRVGWADVQDDPESTILVVEAAEPVEWTRPDELPFEEGKPLPRLGGVVVDGFQACVANGAVRFFKKEIYGDEKLLRALIGRADGELVDLRPYEVTPIPSAPPARSEVVSAPAPETAPADPKAVVKEEPPRPPPPAQQPPKEAESEASLRKLRASAPTMRRRVESMQKLSQLFNALRLFQDQNGSLPPPAIYAKDGRPLLSWRVALLPFLGQQALYRRFKLDEPWDGPNNRELRRYMPRVFGSPGVTLKDPDTTFYQLFVGPGAYEPGTAKRRLPGCIPDGPSNTLAIAEAAEPVPWTAPADLAYAPDRPVPALGGLFADGFWAVRFDGKVEFYVKAIYRDERALRALIGWRDGDVVDLHPYQPRPVELPAQLKNPAIEAARSQAQLVGSRNNLRQLGIAFRFYHERYRRLPSYALPGRDGRPALSWRVALLPFLDQQPLYEKFHVDEPWDGPHNKALLPLMPRVFEAPNGKPGQAGLTYYQVFVGPGAGFDPDPRRPRKFTDVKDGLRSTLLVAEAGRPVPWTKPEDLLYDPKGPLPSLGGLFPHGFQDCAFDGATHFFHRKIYRDEAALRALIGIEDGKAVDPDGFR